MVSALRLLTARALGGTGLRARRQRPQAVEQRFVEEVRRLDLRRVTQIGELDQARVRYRRRRGFAQHRIIAQRRPDRWRREVLAERGRVLVADHQQDGHRELAEFINDGLV